MDLVAARLLAMKEIGLVTACTLRAEVGCVYHFRSDKQLARFCGLSPANRSSSKRQADAGLINACNPTLRATLIESAHSLARHNERWSGLVHPLFKAG